MSGMNDAELNQFLDSVAPKPKQTSGKKLSDQELDSFLNSVSGSAPTPSNSMPIPSPGTNTVLDALIANRYRPIEMSPRPEQTTDNDPAWLKPIIGFIQRGVSEGMREQDVREAAQIAGADTLLKNVTAGGLDLNKGTAGVPIVQNLFPRTRVNLGANTADVLNTYHLPEETAAMINSPGFRTPLDFEGAALPIGVISRGLSAGTNLAGQTIKGLTAGKALGKVGEAAGELPTWLQRAGKIGGRLFHAGTVGGIWGLTEAEGPADIPGSAGENALGGVIMQGAGEVAGAGINALKIKALKNISSTLADWAYGTGKFSTLEEAQGAAGKTMEIFVKNSGGIEHVEVKDLNKLNKIIKNAKGNGPIAEPANVTPEPESPVASEINRVREEVEAEQPRVYVEPKPKVPGKSEAAINTMALTLQQRQEEYKAKKGTGEEVTSLQTPPLMQSVKPVQPENGIKEYKGIAIGDQIKNTASGNQGKVKEINERGFTLEDGSFISVNKAQKMETVETSKVIKPEPKIPEGQKWVTEKAATNEGEPKISFKSIRNGDSFVVTEWLNGKKGTTFTVPAEEYLRKSNYQKAKYIESIHKTVYDGFDQGDAIHSRANDAFGSAIQKSNKNILLNGPYDVVPKTGVTSFKLENGKFPFEPEEFGIANDKGHHHQVFRVAKINGLFHGTLEPGSHKAQDVNHKRLEGNLQPGDIVVIQSSAEMRVHQNIYEVKELTNDQLDVEEISTEKAIELLQNKEEDSRENDIMKPEGEKHGGAVEPGQVPVNPVRANGAGTLEKISSENVSGSSESGNAHEEGIRSPGEGQRNKSGLNSKGNESGRSRGNRSADVHPTPARESKQRVTEHHNYGITDKDHIGTGTEGERLRNNIEAIQILKKVMSEKRKATPDEQAALVKYVGWGGLANTFNERLNDGQMAKAREELNQLLTKDEYESARASVKNAHYTSPEVIKAIYEGVKHLGFHKGYVLEPAVGVGHFIGLMPEKMAGQSHVTGIELDSLTGNIAKLLYPDSDIRVMGFEKADLSPIYDLVISNVPFGNYGVYDAKIPKSMRQSIHNYFFAKALESVRPGGMIVFITSRYTMDARPNSYAAEAENANARKYISNRANFLGAIRLPYTAFKGNAGTEVVTDIIVLQRRGEGIPDKSQPWLEVKRKGDDWRAPFTNEYYHDHPEMILGKETNTGSMYGGGQYNVEPGGENLGEAIVKAFQKFPKAVYRPKSAQRLSAPKVTAMIPAPGSLKEGSLTVRDERLYQNHAGHLREIPTTPGELKRIAKQVELIDAVKENMSLQYGDGTEEQIRDSQRKLNRLYDAFVKDHGSLHDKKNASKIADDPEFPRLLSLENWDNKTQTARKADIFSKRTIQKYEAPTKADNSHEALIYSLNEHGFVDLDYMAKITGKREEDVISDLGDAVYQNPDSKQWETSDAYLSGNVRAKLKVAENYGKLEPKYQRNVKALKNVIPKDIMPAQIKVRLGATWIPIQAYQDFVKSIFGSPVDIQYSPALGEWKIGKGNRFGSLATNEWGTSSKDFYELFRLALNQQRPQVFDTVYEGEKEMKVLSQEKTLAAIAKQEKIQKAFEDWIWKDQDRAEKLARIYNDTNNSIVLRSWDGSHMTFPGMNSVWAERLRLHQKNAIWRGVQGGNCLLAHCVGAGKTFEQIAVAMELKRLGIVGKMVWAVPKHLIKQSADSALDLYPGAKILMAGDKSFGKDERREFMNKIATGDWDLVVISHDNLKSIPMSETAIRDHYRERIDQLETAIREEVEAGTRSQKGLVKKLEAAKSRLQTRLDEEVANIKKNQDIGNIAWEETGIDGLMVDEAHLFKNLFFHTKMEKVAGLGSQQGTQKTTDLYMKIRHLQRLNGGRGIVFATGTPVANSIAELYHMQRYLQPDALEERGITNFDSWVAQFAQVTPELEMKPTGQGYRLKDRLSSFINLPELKQMFRTFADIQTPEMLKLPVPKVATGKPEEIAAEPRGELLDYIQTLASRAAKLKGKPEKGGDNMLKISGDGRKASLDMRLIDPNLPDDPGSKINLTVNQAVEIYHQTASTKGTQVIFLDLSTPGREVKAVKDEDEVDLEDLGLSDDEKALKSNVSAEAVRIYDDIKKKLIAQGIPNTEIAFIHDAKTIEARRKIFDGMNSGKLRVLLGSTGKLGTGANIQERLAALYNLDAPWKPAEVEQRVGRILRQGNKNDTVHIFNCITKKSFDARTWHILKMKDRFIKQLMNDDMTVREIGDATGDAVLNFAEVAAIASDNPDIIRDIELDNQVSKYRAMKADYERGQREIKQQLNWLPGHIAELKETLGKVKEMMSSRQDTSGDNFSIILGKKTIVKRDEADKYIKKLVQEGYQGDLGKLAGIDISMGLYQGEAAVFLDKNKEFHCLASVSSLEHAVRNLDKEVDRREENIRRLERELSDTQGSKEKPFEFEKELREAEEESKEIKARLLKVDEKPLETAGAEIDRAMAESGQGFLNADATKIATGMSDILDRVKRAMDVLFGRDDGLVKVSDAAVERVLNATKSPLNVKAQVKEAMQGVSTALKDLFLYEWTVKDFPGFQNDLRLFKGVTRDAQKFALDMTLKILRPLQTAREFELFRRLVFLRDLEEGVKEAEPDAQGVARNIGLTEAQIKQAQKELWILAAKTKESDTRVKMALWAHDKVFKAMWDDLKLRGKLSPDVDNRKHYVPHRVLDYMADVDRRFPNLSKRFKTPYRYYLKGRTGSQRLIDTDYVGITLRHLAKLFMDNATDDFNTRIATKFDQNRKLIRAEKAQLYGKRKVPVPGKLYEYKGKRYIGWQYDPGRQMYPVEIVTEDTVKRVIAVGKHKKTYLLPVEIADRLTHFKDSDLNSHVLNALRKANSLYKQLLFSPVTLGIPFQMGNFIGDVMNLYASDAEALRYLAKGWKAAKQWQKNKVDRDLQELTRLAEQSRVMESTFMREAGMPYDPKLAKLQPRRYILRKLNPFAKWSDIAEQRELAPRLAKMYADLKRIEQGEMPKSTVMNTKALNQNGMSTREIAGKLAREVTVDYHKMNGETQRVLRDLLFPMLAFYYGNFPNWFQYVKRSPLNLAIKILLPILIFTMWNWMKFREVEEKLPDYYRVMPHVITGWRDGDGKPIIIALQTPFDMAAKMIGLDIVPDVARRIGSKEISWDEGLKEVGESIGFSPWQNFKDQLTTFIKAPIEAAINKSWFNGRKIVPERLIGTQYDQRLRTAHIVDSWISPKGTWSRNQEEGNIAESAKKYLTKGPVDLPRAFGVRHVDTGREQLNRFYDRFAELQAKRKEWKEELSQGKKVQFGEQAKLQVYSKVARTFTDINKLIQTIEESKRPQDVKDKAIKQIRQRMYIMAERVLKAAQ